MYKQKSLKDLLKTNKGYSLMELMMVLSIIAIVAQIGFTAWLDSKRRAYDSSAVADTRNLIEAVVNDMVGAEDVLYTHEPDDGSRIGAYSKAEDDNYNIENRGDSRTPSLFLSPGVKAIIYGATEVLNTNSGISSTWVRATLWHSGGTPWPDTEVENPDGVREFKAYIDEDNEVITFVGFRVIDSD